MKILTFSTDNLNFINYPFHRAYVLSSKSLPKHISFCTKKILHQLFKSISAFEFVLLLRNTTQCVILKFMVKLVYQILWFKNSFVPLYLSILFWYYIYNKSFILGSLKKHISYSDYREVSRGSAENLSRRSICVKPYKLEPNKLGLVS